MPALEPTPVPDPGELCCYCRYEDDDTHCIVLRTEGALVHYLDAWGRVHSRPDYHFLALWAPMEPDVRPDPSALHPG